MMCTHGSSSSLATNMSGGATVENVSSRFGSMLLEEEMAMNTEADASINSLTNISPMQREMLAVLSQRLNHQHASITPIWRLINGPLSRFIVYTTSDPSEALDEALLQVRNLLEARKAQKNSSSSSSGETQQRHWILQRALKPHQHRIGTFIKKTNLIRRAIGSRTNCSSHSCRTLRAKLTRDTDLLQYGLVDLPTKLPSVVKRILFDNDLVRLMNTAPAADLYKIDWASLVDQAEADLVAFDEWVKEQGERRSTTASV